MVRRNSSLKPSVSSASFKLSVSNLCDLSYSYLLEPVLVISVFNDFIVGLAFIGLYSSSQGSLFETEGKSCYYSA